MKAHIAILREIIDSQNHNIDCDAARDAITTLREKIGGADFNFEFDGSEYRVISKDAIWSIYVDSIKNIVDDCYELGLDKVPDFIAISIDWEQTAKNAYGDGYGHTFSSYDGSEVETSGYYIFRIN